MQAADSYARCAMSRAFARMLCGRASKSALLYLDVMGVCVCDYREGLYMRLGLRVKNYFNAAKMSAMDDSSIFVFLIHLRTCFLVLS